MKRFRIEKRVKTKKNNLPLLMKKQKKKGYSMKQTSKEVSYNNCKRNKVSVRVRRCEEDKSQ